MSLIDRLRKAGATAARAGAAAGRMAADRAMQQPTVRRRVEEARAAIAEARQFAEQQFDVIEQDLWDWIRKMQAEAQKTHRQIERARTADEYYAVLGLQPGADFKAIKQAYRQKMRENHPDRFAHDPQAEAVAHARAQRINEAYQQLTALLTGRENRAT